MITVRIDGQDVPLIFDSGDASTMMLQQSVLDHIHAIPTGGSFKGSDVGGTFESRKFQIARVQLGDAVFTDVEARPEAHSPTNHPLDNGQKGTLGTGLLKPYLVVVDLGHRTMTLFPHATGDSPPQQCRGTSVPFAATQAPAEPVTSTDTDLGRVTLWWDTAATNSFLSQRFIQQTHAATSHNEVATTRFVMGGADFGPWHFKYMNMALPPFFDGFIGIDFFSAHVVCFDFPDKRVVIHP